MYVYRIWYIRWQITGIACTESPRGKFCFCVRRAQIRIRPASFHCFYQQHFLQQRRGGGARNRIFYRSFLYKRTFISDEVKVENKFLLLLNTRTRTAVQIMLVGFMHKMCINFNTHYTYFFRFLCIYNLYVLGPGSLYDKGCLNYLAVVRALIFFSIGPISMLIGKLQMMKYIWLVFESFLY